MEREMMKFYDIVLLGIYVIFLVVFIGRYIKEEVEIINFFLDFFGLGVKSYVIVVFIGKGRLKKIKIEDYIELLLNKLFLK